MNVHLLSVIFTLLALSGAIIVGIVMGKAKIDMVWCSKLGALFIIGFIIMSIGLSGSLIMIGTT